MNIRKVIPAALCAAAIAVLPLFAACSSQTSVVSIEKTGSTGTQDVYTVYYSDGSTSNITVNSGSADGVSADSVVEALYERYKEETGDDDMTYTEFLEKYLTVSSDATTSNINYCLQSCLKIYSEFVETTSYRLPGFGGSYSTSSTVLKTGSGVIYSMDESADGYTYIVTNYHVVYDSDADTSLNGGSKLARSIYCYLYGSEGEPSATSETDENGCAVYDYGNYAIELEYVGGSISKDIAVLRVETDAVEAVNENAGAVTLADGYHVGETAVAVGNPEGYGLSVTQGIVSTENENISLSIDGTVRTYRSLRIDTAIYSGNSGGGLFNADGELIGIVNAGSTTDENINYAIPLEIVKGTADAIIYYSMDGDNSSEGAYALDFGMTFSSRNSKYVYDSSAGCGEIVEEVIVSSVTAGSVAETLGLSEGDKLTALVINGTQYSLSRTFTLEDYSLTLRSGDKVSFVYERGDSQSATDEYTVSFSDLSAVE